MTVFEMQGALRGKAIPGDIKVNESLAAYLVRKLADAEANGVDKFAAHLHDQAPHVEECDMESYEVFGHLATEFAVELREGRV